MHIANPLGLIGLLVVPLVVVLHAGRRRSAVRRIAGVFLWKAVAAESASRSASTGASARALACDLIAVAGLVALACDPRFGHASVQDHGGSWTVVALRLVLAAVVVTAAMINSYGSTSRSRRSDRKS